MFKKLLEINPSSSKYTKAAKLLAQSFRDHEVGYTGGQIAYFLILSLFPFLIFVNSLIASLNIPVQTAIQFLEPLFPTQIVSFIATYIEYISENRGLSLLSFGIVLAIFSASKSVRSVANAFNNAYSVPARRGFFAQLLFSMLFILAFAIILIICIVLVAFGNGLITNLLEQIDLHFAFVDLFSVWRWVTLSAIVFFILSLIYKLLPDKKVKYADTMPGTILAFIGFLVLTSLFSLYVNNFMVNSVLYGSIGAIILLMLWMYFAGIILVLGAELNNIWEKLKNEK